MTSFHMKRESFRVNMICKTVTCVSLLMKELQCKSSLGKCSDNIFQLPNPRYKFERNTLTIHNERRII